MGKLFGTDGARGVANSELTPEIVFKIGRAAAFVLTKHCDKIPRIIIGMDTRKSGPMLNCALSAGICSVGAEVINLGVIPTPAVAYLVREYDMDAGIVISASHNPMKDNGIKIFNSQGFKLSDDWENEIEEIIFTEEDSLPRPIGEEVGSVKNNHKAHIDYVNFLAGIFPDMNLNGLKVAIDCANGATYQCAPMVLEKLGAQVFSIHSNPDGSNINANCGSTHMDSLKKFVVENGLDIGIAFDGDGDRCLMVDEKGKPVDGDEIMSVCAAFMKEKGSLKKDTIVATVMSNLGLFVMGEEKNINIEKTAVGDKYVLERMLEIGANIGGEQSGHVIFLDYNTTGDGILTALNMLHIMNETGKSLSALNTQMKIFPQVLVNATVKNENKYSYGEVDEIKKAIEELEEMFAGKGRVLIRASGTEALVRVMIEGENQAVLEKEARRVADLIEKHLG